MDTKWLEEYQKQMADWQKAFFDSWLNNIPNGKEGFKYPEMLEKNLEVQEQMINRYLEAQETASRLSIESQRKFWSNYFELLRKTSATLPQPV